MDIIQNNQCWDVCPTYNAYNNIALLGLNSYHIVIIINSDFIVHDPSKNWISNIDILNKAINKLDPCDKLLVNNAIQNRIKFWGKKYERIKNQPSERSKQVALVKQALLQLLII